MAVMGRPHRAFGVLALVAACSPDPIVEPPPRYEPCCLEPAPEVCFAHLEIEEFSGPWNVQRNISPYYGQGFAISPGVGVADTVLRAEVQLVPGRYVVWTRGFRDHLAREWQVSVDGSTVAATHGSFAGAPGYAWVRAGEVDVTSTLAEVVVHDAGASFEVADAIALSSDLDYDPLDDEDDWRVLDRDFATDMLRDDVLDRMARARAEIPIAADPQTFDARRGELRARIRESMGLRDLPERTPLDAEVVGTVSFDGYRIEKLRFESRPGVVVTAHVYVPDGPGPFPVVVSPIGHYYVYGKSSPYVAPRAHGLAKLGYASLVYDAFGQGERDVGGHSHDEGWRLALTGQSNLSIMVWDTMRAIDYLETRSDIDTTRLAVTGASGGGLNSLYTSIVDDRISASLPVVFVTGFEDIVIAGGPHDPCTYQWGVAGYTNMGEMAGLFAPKPQLLMAGDRDVYFPADGTRRAYEQANQIYSLFGADDDVRLFVAQSDHEYHLSMRERLYGFVEEHLSSRGDGAPIPEPSFALPNPGEARLRVFDGAFPNDRNPRSLAEQWAIEAIDRLPSPDETSAATLRSSLIATLHPGAVEFVPEIVEIDAYTNPSGVRIERLRIDVDPGIALAAYVKPGSVGSPAIVIVDGGGLTRPEIVLEPAPEDLTIVYVAPRGDGESAWNEHLATANNFMLGDTLLAQRASDVAKVGRALKRYGPTAGAPIGLLALGEHAALTAAFSQAMYGAYDAASIGPVMSTFMESFQRELPMATRVFGLLKHGDMPQVLWLAAERPLQLVLTSESHTLYHRDDWVDAVADRAQQTDSLTRTSGLTWLADQLR